MRLAPAVVLQQAMGSAKLPAVESLLHFTSLVTNTGDAPLIGVTEAVAGSSGAGAAPGLTCPSRTLATGATLAPQQSMPCPATYEVQAADVGESLVASVSAHATDVHHARTTTRPATVGVRVPAAAASAQLAITGAGGLGWTIVGTVVLALLLGMDLLRWRRTAG